MSPHILVNVYAPILGHFEFDPYVITQSSDYSPLVDEHGSDGLFWDFVPDELEHAGFHVWEPGAGGVPCILRAGDYSAAIDGSLRPARASDLASIVSVDVEPSGADRLYVVKHGDSVAWLLNFDVSPEAIPELDVIQDLAIERVAVLPEDVPGPGIWCIEGDLAHTGYVDEELEAEFGFEEAVVMLDARSASIRRVTSAELQWLLADRGARIAAMEDNLTAEE